MVFVRFDGPDRWDVEPVFLELILEDDSILYLKKATLGCETASTSVHGIANLHLNTRI